MASRMMELLEDFILVRRAKPDPGAGVRQPRREPAEPMYVEHRDEATATTTVTMPMTFTVTDEARARNRCHDVVNEAARTRWVAQRLYERLRHRNAQAAHRMHDTDGPPYPWDTTGVDLELELWRVSAGIEYDTQRVGRRIAMAYTDSMAALLALEARYHDQCAANPLT